MHTTQPFILFSFILHLFPTVCVCVPVTGSTNVTEWLTVECVNTFGSMPPIRLCESLCHKPPGNYTIGAACMQELVI